MLTEKQILALIEMTRREVVATFDRYEVVTKESGYHSDPEIARLQGVLSIMLEARKRAQSSE